MQWFQLFNQTASIASMRGVLFCPLPSIHTMGVTLGVGAGGVVSVVLLLLVVLFVLLVLVGLVMLLVHSRCLDEGRGARTPCGE